MMVGMVCVQVAVLDARATRVVSSFVSMFDMTDQRITLVSVCHGASECVVWRSEWCVRRVVWCRTVGCYVVWLSVVHCGVV